MANYTTRKEFKAEVRKEIMLCLSEDYASEKEAAAAMLQEFNKWFKTSRIKNRQEGFKQYCMCVPSLFNAEFTYHGISNALKSWFEKGVAGYSYKEQDSVKEANLYYNLLYREMPYVFKALGLDWREQ